MKLSNGKNMLIKWFTTDFKFAIIINEIGIEMGMHHGMNIYLAMNPLHYQGKVQGMCGNMDFEKKNEFQTPEWTVVTNSKLFGLTWINPATKCSKKGNFLLTYVSQT